MSSERDQYRDALLRELSNGPVVNSDELPPFADGSRPISVAFADESVTDVLDQVLLTHGSNVHLAIAPTDYRSGQLHVLTLTDGRHEDHDIDSCYCIDAHMTCGMLVAWVSELHDSDRRLGFRWSIPQPALAAAVGPAVVDLRDDAHRTFDLLRTVTVV